MRSVIRRNLSSIFEFLAFVAAAAFVAHLFGLWWALAPTAIYLFFVSLALDRGKR